MARHIDSADLPEDIARTAEAQEQELRLAAVRAALADGELSGVFEGDPFASVRAELGLPRHFAPLQDVTRSSTRVEDDGSILVIRILHAAMLPELHLPRISDDELDE